MLVSKRQGPPGAAGTPGTPGAPGQGVPTGGNAGEYLRKIGITDYATAWANATTVRSDLGLGTAATANTGTSAGNVVALNGSAQLPAIDGSLLTNLPTQSPYAADAWDYSWTAGSNSMTADGWTLGAGASSPTDSADTIGGVVCRTLTPPAGATASWLYHTVTTPPVGPFEFRALVYLPVSTTALLYSVGMNAAVSGINRRFILAVDNAGLESYASSAFTASPAMTGLATPRWLWITVRVVNGGTGSSARAEIWLGPNLVWQGATSGWQALSTAGRIEIGKTSAASGVAVMGFSQIQFRNGINEAPPSYTFRSLLGEVGP